MDALLTLCSSAKDYPLNFTVSALPIQANESLSTRLNEHSPRLFCAENVAIVEFLEHGHAQQGP